jgi:Fe-S-cluster containining protein
MIPLNINDTFEFSCHPGISCFNQCCRDLNQFLYPYDILRLKSHLALNSSDFLDQYTRQHTGPATGLPIVTLKPKDGDALRCPFVSKSGCKVYAHRPASCRIYPLARGVTINARNNEMQEHFALLQEAHCCGHGQGRTWTPASWVSNQKLAEYNRINDWLFEIIQLKKSLGSGPLNLAMQRLFQLLLYDLDRFRNHIFSKNLMADQKWAQHLIETARSDDLVLLEVGHRWLIRILKGK